MGIWIPGTKEDEENRVIYFEFSKYSRREREFNKLIEAGWEPNLDAGGSAILKDCIIKTPAGPAFTAVEFWGALSLWRSRVTKGARELGVATGEIRVGHLVLTDGRSIPLADCEIDFARFHKKRN